MKIRSYGIILFLIVILQTITIFHWAGEKSNYNIDELYTFGYAQDFTRPRKNFKKITFSDDWQYETWVDNEVLKDQLALSKEESLLTLGPGELIEKLLLTKYNYYGFLNIAETVFSGMEPAHMPGVILNLIFFIITQLILYRITEELTGNRVTALLAVTMYGFSPLAIGMTCFIRFYTMVIMMFMAALRMHQVMRRTESLPRFELLTILSMAVLLIGMRNSQLLFVLGTALVFFFALDLLINRKFSRMCCYLLTTLPAGLYYVLRKTNFLDVIFNPQNYLDQRSSETTVAYGLTRLKSWRLVPLAKSYLKMFCFQLFGSKYVFAAFCLIMAVLAVMWLSRRRKNTGEKRSPMGFSLVILALALVYTASALMANLRVPRYISFVFPMAAILIWSWADLFTRGRSYRKWILPACAVLSISGAIAGQLRHSDVIQYIYREDRPLIRKLAETNVNTAIVVYRTINWDSEHAVYDCINLLPDSARLYPVDEDHHSIDTSECPDEMLIWAAGSLDKTVDPYTRDLKAAGYVITKIGSDHTSDVYIARKAMH